MGDILTTIKKFVDLKPDGSRHWTGLCPFHGDKDPSFVVTPDKKLFKCFGCGIGGSEAHFLYEYNKKFGTKHRATYEPVKYEKKVDKEDSYDKWKIITPVPSYVEQPSFRHFNLGVPAASWRYTNEKGETMFYTCRFNKSNGDKDVLPYTFCTNGKQSKWMWKGITKNKPLYKLHLLSTDKTIVLVEGEKTADTGNDNTDKYVFTTFQGGSNAIQLTDYSPLNGKNVILLDDNDEVGYKCMDGVESLIIDSVLTLKRVHRLTKLPHAWDIADRKWKRGELDNFIERILL
jgi:hypothetical protein